MKIGSSFFRNNFLEFPTNLSAMPLSSLLRGDRENLQRHPKHDASLVCGEKRGSFLSKRRRRRRRRP